jgi:vitamin B12 transporter
MKNLLLIFLVSLITNFAFAQVLDNQIEELLVNASLLPIDSRRSANAITVIDREDIKNRAVTSVSDLLRDVPGLAVSRSGVQGSQTQIRIRGGEANHLLVLIDGIEANNASQSDELNWGTLVASDIERIEIIRGPQSSMQGSDALAGVINIITQSAEQPLSARVFVESGSFDTQNNGFSAGINNGKFDARLGVSFLHTEGDNIARTGFEKDGYENTKINFKSGLNVSNQLRFDFSARQSDGMNEYDADVNFDGLVDDQDNKSEFQNSAFGLKAGYVSINNKWQHQLLISQSENDNEDFNKNILGTSTNSSKDQYRFIGSLFLGDLSRRISMLIEREEENFQQRGIVNDYGSYGVFDPNQDRTRNTDSIALEYRADISEKLTIAASTRVDDNSEFKNANTSRLEVIYELNDDASIRSAYGTAVKNPTFTERFGFYTNFIGNPFLEPEESVNWELGIDQRFFQGSLNLAATFFNSELENEIDGNSLDPITFGYTAINKQGLSKREGIELYLSGQLTDMLSLYASYTFTDSVELDANGQYQDEVRRPRNISSLNLSWQARKNLHVNTNIQFNGSQEDIVFPNNQTLDGFTLVNISANFSANEKLDIYLRLDNLLDENYEEVYSYQALGFGAHFGLRYRF